MVKLKGPSLSLEASGKLADVVAFSSSKKRAYLKQHAAPANPRTPKQLSIRACMTFISQEWKTLSAAQRDTWQALADAHQIAPYHAYLKLNQQRWHTARGLTKANPAAEASTTPKSAWSSGTPGIKMVTIEVFPELPPATWGYFVMRAPYDITHIDWDIIVALFPYTWHDPNPTYVDQLETGTYYYRCVAFNTDGIFSPQGRQWTVVIA